MSKKKILITGGNGFLGRHLKTLLGGFKNLELKILDVGKEETPNSRDFSYVQSDITDYEDLEKHFREIDAVFHLAGIVSFSKRDMNKLYSVNIEGTRNVLKASLANGVPRVIHVSSVAALGYNDDKFFPINEDFNFNWTPVKIKKKYYMLSKKFADDHVTKFRNKGLNCDIVYPGLMFGPYDKTNSVKLFNAIYNQKIPFNMPGGTNIIDVRDVALGLREVYEKGRLNTDYLLSGENLEFKEVNKKIADVIGSHPPKLTLPRFLSPIFYLTFEAIEKIYPDVQLTADNVDSSFKFRYFDNSKARTELGWKPRYSFEQTVRDTWDWMKEERLIG